MKSFITKIAVSGVALSTLALVVPLAQAATPNWNVTGNYTVAFNYLGSDFAHDVSLTQGALGVLTGNGTSGVYAWTITSGSVSGDTVDFYADYTATADAVTPLTTMHVVGTIASNGTMSGTWSDNYAGGARAGTWTTVVGTPLALGSLVAEDFGVVSYDTGLGMLSGYTAGFGVSDATLAGATSVEVKLYSGATLLQTNTAILPKFNADITGTQFSSPFDVSGSFAYATDGYWTNVRAGQYGQSVPATKVVATVTLANGKVVTAENTLLVGDPTTIYPVTPPVATTPTDKNQCKNDGWMTFTSPTFQNQGECVKFVEKADKNDEGKVEGNLKMSPDQAIKFDIKNKDDDKKGKDKDKGRVEYWNNDVALHYKTNVLCSSIDQSSRSARFMFQIPAGHPGLSGLYVVAQVKETAGKKTPDLYGHAATGDLATAKTWCETGAGFSPTMYDVTKGKVEVKK